MDSAASHQDITFAPAWRDPMIRLALAARALADLAAAQERGQHRQGRPCDPDLIRVGERYTAWVFALAALRAEGVDPAVRGSGTAATPTSPDPGEYAGVDPDLLADLAAAARRGTDVPAWRLAQWLRRHDVPAEFVPGGRRPPATQPVWAGVPGSGVVQLPDRRTTRSAAQIAAEEPWMAERAAVQRANSRTAAGETVRARNRATHQIEQITPAEALIRRWEARAGKGGRKS